MPPGHAWATLRGPRIAIVPQGTWNGQGKMDIRGEGVSQDFYGVSDIVAMPFFPQSLRGLFLLFGFPNTLVDKQVRIMISDKERPEQKAWADLHTKYDTGDRQQVRLDGFAKHDSQKGT